MRVHGRLMQVHFLEIHQIFANKDKVRDFSNRVVGEKDVTLLESMERLGNDCSSFLFTFSPEQELSISLLYISLFYYYNACVLHHKVFVSFQIILKGSGTKAKKCMSLYTNQMSIFICTPSVHYIYIVFSYFLVLTFSTCTCVVQGKMAFKMHILLLLLLYKNWHCPKTKTLFASLYSDQCDERKAQKSECVQ